MDLKTFIKETLTQINEALDETNRKYIHQDKKYIDHTGTLFSIEEDNSIEFEVLVSTNDETMGSAGLKIHVVSVGGEMKQQEANSSKIKFKITPTNNMYVIKTNGEIAKDKKKYIEKKEKKEKKKREENQNE